jgi:uncharacterized protein (TIGR03437 family)
MIAVNFARLCRFACMCAAVAMPAAAAPEIRAILNAASYTGSGLPKSGIARGSMFVVFGAGLGPQDLRQSAGFPLQKSLAGTSIRVTVGTTAVDALMVYAWAAQVAAILPSGTPEGIGLMQVTYNGHTSQAGAFLVVRSGPGILTQNEAGTGAALAQNVTSAADQPRNGLSRPAQPGQALTLWGTGLGPISADESAAPVPQDLNIDLQVFVGGKPAQVRYKGRSGCCAGIDQVTFDIPAGVSGCYVPVVVQVDGAPSNFTTISVAGPGGGDCTDLTGISGPMLEKLLAGGTARIGSIVLSVNSSGIVSESGIGEFFQAGLSWLASRVTPGLPSPGSCMVNPVTLSAAAGMFVDSVALDAGPLLTVSGPKGSRQVLQRYPGYYSETFAQGTVTQFLQPGTYTVDNGAGGPGVGSFQATLAFPAPLSATVQQSATGTALTWQGGDPAGYVVIQGSAQSASGATTNFTCVERTGAGQFALPPVLLSSLPGLPSGITAVAAAGTAAQNRFKANGLDLAFFSFCSPISALCNGPYFDY